MEIRNKEKTQEKGNESWDEITNKKNGNKRVWKAEKKATEAKRRNTKVKKEQ